MDRTVFRLDTNASRSIFNKYYSIAPGFFTRLKTHGLRYLTAASSIFVLASVVNASSVTATVGQDVTISVVASGTAPFTYQWYRNNTAISGATGSSYVLDNVDALDSGGYYAVVKNRAGSTTSDTATLTVTSASAVAPKIVTPPTGLNVTVGQPATFKVVASGTGPLTYTWRKNGTKVGTNSATFTISSALQIDAGWYSVVVSNSAGSVTSNAVSLGVNLTQILTKPSITSQPKAVTVAPGQSASFSVTATGSGPLHYQWKKNGVNITGATSSKYTIAAVSSTHVADYTVQVTNTLGYVTSQKAHLSIAIPGTR
ncbi:MAG TPA: immunoglobulin domain-containing protein [Opitutaceae bacterium]|nr:immunoglobulin domain-containing protein [Opitutaceae bacterium]